MATIVIPAYNEQHNIEETLKRIPKKYKVLVVDDGSQDSTAAIAERMGAKCIRLSKNRGKGYVCRLGAKHADSEIIFMDSDAQFDAGELPKFTAALKKYDLVLGQRVSGVPLQRRLSNKIAAKLVNAITKKKFSDVLCGFRAIKKEKFFSLHLEKDGYEFESEMIIRAVENGLSIGTVPVSVRYHKIRGMTLSKSVGLFAYLVKAFINSR